MSEPLVGMLVALTRAVLHAIYIYCTVSTRHMHHKSNDSFKLIKFNPTSTMSTKGQACQCQGDHANCVMEGPTFMPT
jgi:hypothetical protein